MTADPHDGFDRPETFMDAARAFLKLQPRCRLDATDVADALSVLARRGYIVSHDAHDWLCNEYAQKLAEVERVLGT